MRAHLLKSFLPSLVLAALIATGGRANQEDLASQGYMILKKYCYSCHGQEFNGNAELNVMDRDRLISEDNGYVVPGDPESSYLLQRITDLEMPPEDNPRPSDEEVAALSRWIAADAPFPQRPQRPFKGEPQILRDVLDFLQDSREEDRPFIRFFTLTHLYNNNQRVTDLELRLYRAALSKAANSLSWEPDIVVPTAVDEQQTIFAVDLRDYGWDERSLWEKVLRKYPYGLKHSTDEVREIRRLYNDLVRVSGTDLAYVRADWFVAAATRPPLYHTLLDIPERDADLEKLLRVNVIENFRDNQLARAGFAESGVSTQNRLVERHRAAYGAYWKSYDFLDDVGRGNLFRFPLGPDFAGNPFDRQAFDHDGGEMIFTLPNGLQGYMLTDGDGQRIGEGPIQVVQDSLKTSGSPVIVNGLSCMSCHKHGMISFQDALRDGIAVGGEARLKVDELFPEAGEMDRLVQRDRNRFLTALQEAMGPFLQTGPEADKHIADFAEPVGAIARLYLKDLGLAEAAYEIGIENPEDLKTAIKLNRQLRQMGLASLVNGTTIKRSVWESTEGLVSPAQQVTAVLGRGTPLVFLGE